MAKEKSNVLDTTGGEMPNPNASRNGPTKTELDEFMKVAQPKQLEEKIPESSGDMADRAENEIENDLQGEIERARGSSRRNTNH